MLSRIRAAFRTNEPQATAVIAMTMLNVIVLFTSPRVVPLHVWLIVVLAWPAIAFVSNIINPIPEDRK